MHRNNSMVEVVLMVGWPASGKSSFSRRHMMPAGAPCPSAA